MKTTIAVLTLVCAVAMLGVASAQSVTVNAPAGPIVGKVAENAQEFRGIPYAKPPVGSLRWQDPVAADVFTTPFEASSDAPGCPQQCVLPSSACPPTTSEDCLFLNVFTPVTATAGDDLPVMIFVHGGDFVQGYAGGILYDGAWLADNHDVIMVVIQYRLGALGFLLTEYGITGNFALKDQQLAFKWVQQNIGAFGGDPNQVTIFGQSAGACSVATHLVMPSSAGLFQNAILESEPFGIPYRTASSYVPVAKAYAKYAGCDPDSNYDACLMNVGVDALMAAQVRTDADKLAELDNLMQLFLPWTPVVGSDMLAEQVMGMWQRGEVHDVPIAIGTVWDECVPFIYSAFAKPMSKLYYDVIMTIFFGVDDLIKINEQMPVPSNQTSDVRMHMAAVTTEALFTCSTRNATLSLTQSATRTQPIHVYHYDHTASFSKIEWGANYSECWNSVCHASELVFVFHSDVSKLGGSYTASEDTLSASMGTYWTNIAKTGSPGSFGGLKWPAINMATQDTMKFMTPANAVHSHAFEDACEFWDSLGWWSRHVV